MTDIITLDGAFAEQPDGPPRFVQLPALTSMDVAEVLLTIRCRVLRLLARRGVIETPDDLELLPSDETERDPVLAQLTAAAVCGQAPAVCSPTSASLRRCRVRPPLAHCPTSRARWFGATSASPTHSSRCFIEL